jgi:hypothetical protein
MEARSQKQEARRNYELGMTNNEYKTSLYEYAASHPSAFLPASGFWLLASLRFDLILNIFTIE